MIYDTKTWEYPYLYNLIDQYRSLEKYNNGYSYNMMFVGPGWMNKMGRWEQPYELLYKSYSDGCTTSRNVLSGEISYMVPTNSYSGTAIHT